ncbi:MAG: AAA family ATPase [Anaerolineae bacterium]|nr:AAA family ATPase [Anaerolineae bacterium]
MGQVVAIANQKGGVGKTTTAINLSACMAAAGKRVLLIDFDPQGNATSGLGLNKNELEYTVYDSLIDGVPLREVVVPTMMDRLHLAPANRQLVGAEVELVQVAGRNHRFRAIIETVRNEYEYIYVDCPPSLSLLTVNALAAADGVIITLQCEYYALEGLSELLQTVKLIRDNLNPSLKVEGVLLTMYQHTNLSNQVMEDVRSHFGDKVFQTTIPRNVTLSEAPSHGKPVIFYDLKSPGAKAYLALAREVVSRG